MMSCKMGGLDERRRNKWGVIREYWGRVVEIMVTGGGREQGHGGAVIVRFKEHFAGKADKGNALILV